MKWFKHSTSSHDDPDLSDAWDEFGDAGPTVFWVILEIYGSEFNNLSECGNMDVSLKFLERKLRRKYKKFEKIMSFFEKRQRIHSKVYQDRIVINIPKFLKLASNWTARNEKPTEAPTEVTTEAPTAIEKKKNRIEEKKKTYTDEFLAFYNSYPKRIGRDAAWKAWQKCNGNRPSIESILKTLSQQKQTEQWTKDGGQFIPNPATWLNQGRWADEVTVKPKSRWESLDDTDTV